VWLLDPIDGTKNFLRGVPVWATLVALVEHGRPVVGVISAPALRRRWWAATGAGAHTRDAHERTRAITVSGVGDLADAYVSTTHLGSWTAHRSRVLSGTPAQARHPGAGGMILGQRLATDSQPTYGIVKRPWSCPCCLGWRRPRSHGVGVGQVGGVGGGV
jgi:fructose-1,6-bisphosphatase/inositol monophosphatase family enzyme